MCSSHTGGTTLKKIRQKPAYRFQDSYGPTAKWERGRCIQCGIKKVVFFHGAFYHQPGRCYDCIVAKPKRWEPKRTKPTRRNDKEKRCINFSRI